MPQLPNKQCGKLGNTSNNHFSQLRFFIFLFHLIGFLGTNLCNKLLEIPYSLHFQLLGR